MKGLVSSHSYNSEEKKMKLFDIHFGVCIIHSLPRFGMHWIVELGGRSYDNMDERRTDIMESDRMKKVECKGYFFGTFDHSKLV